MPNLFILLGNQNTRKSSTIRALTGIYRESYYLVETYPGQIMVYAKSSSLQESRVQPQDFIVKMTKAKYDSALIALWIHDHHYTNPATGLTEYFPIGSDYIAAFINANLIIQELVVLGASQLATPLPKNCPSPHFVAGSATLAANEISCTIRHWWNWM